MRVTNLTASGLANGQASKPTPCCDALFRDIKNRAVNPPLFPTGVRFADTHAHLDMLHHPGVALARSAAHAVNYVVTIIDPTEEPRYTLDNLETWRAEAKKLLEVWHAEGVLLAKPNAFPEVVISAGCHPHNAKEYTAAVEKELLFALRDSRARAFGEIGLDYHYNHSPRDVQQNVYRRQLELAHELELPVLLHLREAHEDGLRILREIGAPSAGTLLHCYNLDYATLEPFLELDCYVAFGGPLTFKKSDDVRDAARRTPLERIVTETDAPFMAPHPVRGVSSGPEHVIFTAARLAEVFGIGEADSAQAQSFYEQLFQNTLNFFEQ